MKTQIKIIILLLFCNILIAGILIPVKSANAQATATPGPPVIDYVDIDGEYLGVQRTVTIGDLGLSIIGLAILTVITIHFIYKIVVDKLP